MCKNLIQRVQHGMKIEMIGNKMLKVNCAPIYLAGEMESVLHSHCFSYPS
jgi:serine protease inhibitor ecotin